MNISGQTQQLERYLEERLVYFRVLLDLTQEQVRITKEKQIDLKRLNFILQQKEDQLKALRKIDHILSDLHRSQIVKEKTILLTQIIKNIISLEEVSYRDLYSGQLALREELVSHYRKKGMMKLYINRPGQITCPKFMEKEI
jgi:hypothetical protein